MSCRGAHQGRDRRPTDRGHVEQGEPALTRKSLVVGRQGLRGVLLQALFPAQGDVLRIEGDAEPILSGRYFTRGIDVGGTADHQARLLGVSALSRSSERRVAEASSNNLRACTGSCSSAARRVTAKASASRHR